MNIGGPLNWQACARLLSPPCQDVSVPLRRLPQARLLWLNERAARDDANFHAMGADTAAYGRHLLTACGFVVSAPGGGSDAEGHADRYGGAGIGRNGGSGRNVFVNGYQIKGVGRTPLVSALTAESHASGGAYLEECVREAIFSEVVAAEFPYGAVPTLAIIDTGRVQIWDTALGPKRERRTLLVRPAFLRPAHFERAVGFHSGRHLEGLRDHGRVVQTFGTAVEVLGRDTLREQFEALGSRWAHQLAYAFVHRLPHGSNTSSNIAFDGRLVDFGAMTALPSWSKTATALLPDPFESRFASVEQAIRSLSYYFGRHLHPKLGEAHAIEVRVSRARADFERCVTYEVLRLCGVPDGLAADAVVSPRAGHLWRYVRRCIAHYQTEQIDFVESVQLPGLPWDLHRVWEARRPAHLNLLHGVLMDLVAASARDEARQTCLLRCSPRPQLYAPATKENLYAALEAVPELGPREDARRIAHLVEATVLASRRDRLGRDASRGPRLLLG